ncbi:MAG: ATP-dependent zinc metalloprotease FtsH [Mycobacteriaceae bacterium]
MTRKNMPRNVGIALVLLLLVVGFSFFSNSTRGYTTVDTSAALTQLQTGKVKQAQIDDREQQLRLTLAAGTSGVKNVPDGTTELITKYPADASEQIFNDVRQAKLADGFTTEVNNPSWISSLLSFALPLLLVLGLLFFFMNRAQGGGRGGVMGFGKSKAKQITKDMPQTTFADVAGADEAVEELYEIKDFLQNPQRYQALGAKIPKGVLLYGPPGTGKTLLARAVAGEAGVPFFTISGSDFVEMFVGVGASRVRDMFEQAKQNAPAIIFVDEIDAVGRQRGAGMGGGHDEREQTLNQLLVEMDGFGARTNVILIAATNRPDILDPALLRPGRFDRQIPVGAPDLAGRKAILRVHSTGKPIADDADMDGLAKRTVGMSGADLANVLNEAALLTARENGTLISAANLEESVDRVVGGPRRKSRLISEHEKKITAYHEGGHALAAWAMPDIEPVYKVTILARGRTGGHALAVPEDDKGLMTRSEMLARLVFAMGGRAAEELVFHEPTTGASSDIEQATKIARAMVTEYGMSSALGAVKYGQEQGDPFVGRSMGNQADYSLEVAHEIDEEVRKLIEAAHTEAWDILNTYRDALDALASELLETETLNRKDLERVLADVQKRPRITAFNDFGGRTPSDRPPVQTPGERAIERGEPWPPPAPAPRPDLRKPEPVGAGVGGWAGSSSSGGQPGPNQGGGQPWGGPQGYANPPGQGGWGNAAPRPPQGPPPRSQSNYGAPPGWSAPGWPPSDSDRRGGGPRNGGPGNGGSQDGDPRTGGFRDGAPRDGGYRNGNGPQEPRFDEGRGTRGGSGGQGSDRGYLPPEYAPPGWAAPQPSGGHRRDEGSDNHGSRAAGPGPEPTRQWDSGEMHEGRDDDGRG